MAAPAVSRARKKSRTLLTAAGVMGMCGVAVGAAGAHRGGGGLAQLSSDFLLLHAAAVTGLAAYVAAVPYASGIVAVCATALVLGTAAFSGDLALVAFGGLHLVPGLAPVGGVLMLLGWIGVAVAPWYRSVGGDAD